MKEVLILEDKSETRKVLAGLVKEVHSDAVIYEAADEKTAYDIAMKRTIDLFLVDIILHPQQHDDDRIVEDIEYGHDNGEYYK